MITLNNIIYALKEITITDNQIMISEAVIDSRKAIPGSLFIAMPGERSDGHAFVRNAFENGAIIALVQKDMGAEFRVLDLRESQSNKNISIPQTPFCIRVEDSLKVATANCQILASKIIRAGNCDHGQCR